MPKILHHDDIISLNIVDTSGSGSGSELPLPEPEPLPFDVFGSVRSHWIAVLASTGMYVDLMPPSVLTFSGRKP